MKGKKLIILSLLMILNQVSSTTIRYMVDDINIQNCLAMRDIMEQTPLFDSVKFNIWQFFKKDPKQSFKSFRNIIVEALDSKQLNPIGFDFSGSKSLDEIEDQVAETNEKLKKILTGINIQTFISKKSKLSKKLEKIKDESLNILKYNFRNFKSNFVGNSVKLSEYIDMQNMDDSDGDEDKKNVKKINVDEDDGQGNLEDDEKMRSNLDLDETKVHEFIHNYKEIKKAYYEKYFEGKGNVKGFFHFFIDRKKNKVKKKVVKLKMDWYKKKQESHEANYREQKDIILQFDKKYNNIQEGENDYNNDEELTIISNTKISNLPFKYLVNYYLWMKDKLNLIDVFQYTSAPSKVLVNFLQRTFKSNKNAMTTYTNIVELYYRELFYDKLKDNIQKMADVFFDEETADFLPMTDIFHPENQMGGDMNDHHVGDPSTQKKNFNANDYYKSTKEGGIYNLKSINNDIKKLNSSIYLIKEEKAKLVEKLRTLIKKKMKKVLKLIKSEKEYKEYLQAMKRIFISARKARDASAKFLENYNTFINMSALQKNMELEEEDHFTLSKNSMQEIQNEMKNLMEMQESFNPDSVSSIYTSKGNKKEYEMIKGVMSKYYMFLEKYQFYIQKSVLILEQRQAYVQEIEKMDIKLDRYLGKMFDGIQTKIGDVQCFTRTQVSYYIFSMMKMNIIINEELFLKEFLSVKSKEHAMEFMSYNYSVFSSDNYLHYILVKMNQVKLSMKSYSKQKFLEMKTKYIKEFSLIMNMYKDFTEFTIMNTNEKVKVPTKWRRVKKLFISIYEKCKKEQVAKQKSTSYLVKLIVEELIHMIPFLGNIPFASKILAFIVAKLLNLLGKLLFKLGKLVIGEIGDLMEKLKVTFLSVNKERIISVNYREYIHFQTGKEDFGYKKSQLRNLVGIDNDLIKKNMSDTYSTFGNEYSNAYFFDKTLVNEINQDYFSDDPGEVQPNMEIKFDMIEKKYRTNVIDSGNSVNMIDSAILFDEKMITLNQTDYEEYPYEIREDLDFLLEEDKEKKNLNEKDKLKFTKVTERLNTLLDGVEYVKSKKHPDITFQQYLEYEDESLKKKIKNQLINTKLNIIREIKLFKDKNYDELASNSADYDDLSTTIENNFRKKKNVVLDQSSDSRRLSLTKKENHRKSKIRKLGDKKYKLKDTKLQEEFEELMERMQEMMNKDKNKTKDMDEDIKDEENSDSQFDDKIKFLETETVKKFFTIDPEYFMKMISNVSGSSDDIQRKFVIDGILNISTNMNMDRRFNDFFETYFKYKIGENYLIENIIERKKIKKQLLIGSENMDMLKDIEFVKDTDDIDGFYIKMQSEIEKVSSPPQNLDEDTSDKSLSSSDSLPPNSTVDLTPQTLSQEPDLERATVDPTKSSNPTLIPSQELKDQNVGDDISAPLANEDEQKIDFKEQKFEIDDENTQQMLETLYDDLHLIYDKNLKKNSNIVRPETDDDEKELFAEDMFENFIDINPIYGANLQEQYKLRKQEKLANLEKSKKNIDSFSEKSYGFTEDESENMEATRYLLSFDEFNIYKLNKNLFKKGSQDLKYLRKVRREKKKKYMKKRNKIKIKTFEDEDFPNAYDASEEDSKDFSLESQDNIPDLMFERRQTFAEKNIKVTSDSDQDFMDELENKIKDKIELVENNYNFTIKRDEKGQILLIPSFIIMSNSSDGIITEIMKDKDKNIEEYIEKILKIDDHSVPEDLSESGDQTFEIQQTQLQTQTSDVGTVRQNISTETMPEDDYDLSPSTHSGSLQTEPSQLKKTIDVAFDQPEQTSELSDSTREKNKKLLEEIYNQLSETTHPETHSQTDQSGQQPKPNFQERKKRKLTNLNKSLKKRRAIEQLLNLIV